MAINRARKRIEYLDVAKFIGLALVCFCHIPLPEGNFHVWVYSFHMPLFFLISGVFFSPERFSVGKSAMQLLVPFILFNILAWLISLVIGSLSAGFIKIPAVNYNGLLHGSYPIGPSLFLLSLCIIRIFAGLVLKYLNNFWLVVLSLLVLLVLSLTAGEKSWTILSIGPSVLGLPFYLLGYYLKDIVTDERHFSKWYVPISTLVLSILAIYNGLVGIHATQFGDNLLLYLMFGVLGSMAIISLSTCIRIPQPLLSVFMDGALFFICMHTLIFEYLILCWNKITDDFTGNTLVEKVVFTLLTFAVSYPVIIALLRYAPALLGKYRKIGYSK